MIPEFLRNRKTYMLTALVFTIIGVLSLSYAFFSRQSLLGESSNNTINIQTIEGTSQSFITTYQNGSNEIKTGILNLTDTPYTKMSKFEVHNVYDYSLNVTINWDYVSSTLIQSDSSYNLYECSSTNFVSVTMDNVGSTCTLASPTTGNVLPNTGEASRLQNDSDITMLADQTRYYVVIITIGVSNNGRNFQGIIKTKDRFKHILTINYDNGSDSTNMDLASGDEINLPTVTKTGYTFDKWQLTTNYDSSLNESTFIMGSEDTTVKAIWNANTYTVTYNCNGGTNLVTTTTHSYDESFSLQNNICYKFTSSMVYYTPSFSNGSSTYILNQSISNLTSIPNGTVTLIANWSDLFYYNGSYSVSDDYANRAVYGDWKMTIRSSGSLILYNDLFLDVFLVGGGGSGGGYDNDYGAGGGGGGYTFTRTGYSPTSNYQYPVVIGVGGSGVNGDIAGNDGSPTSIFNFIASGGKGGRADGYGGYGGSGGGAYGANGGSNGANGEGGRPGYGQIAILGPYGETGNTREFGEITGYIYSGGGAGCSGGSGGINGGGSGPNGWWAGTNGGNGVANTGGGGGGAAAGTYSGSGGSGIVVIRNHR